MAKYIIWMLIFLLSMPSASFAVTQPTSKTKQHQVYKQKRVTHRVQRKRTVARKTVPTRKRIHTVKRKQTTPVKKTTEAALGTPIRRIEATEPPAYFTKSRLFVSKIEHTLVEFVRKTVDSARYTAYKLGGRQFDESRGVYVLDCSDYVDNLLATVHPKAYLTLADSARSDKPTSQHYYEFFSELGEYPSYYWNKVNVVEELEPGDILVFRKKNGFSRRRASGHVMVVMNKPVYSEDAFLVRVADSAPVGHSEDTREGRASGIGIGTLLLKVNPKTGQPSAYAWKVGSKWTGNVNIAMARPLQA